MPQTAAVVLVNSKGEILLNQRTDDAPRNPGKWSFFGGHIEEGETPQQAAIREGKEELGITLADPTLILESIHNDYTIFVFTQQYDGAPIIQKEGKARGWFAFEDALGLDLSEEVKIAIQRMAKKD